MNDFHPANLGFAGQFDFQELPASADIFSVVQDRLPVIVVAGTLEINFLAGGDVAVSPAVSRDCEFQVGDVRGKKDEHAKTFNRSRKPIDQRVTGIAGSTA